MEEKNTVGRPTKYKEEYNDQAEKLAMLGLVDVQIADVFGVCEDTIHEWKKVYPLFSESLRKGKVVADAEIAYSLFHRGKGYSHPDTDIRVLNNEIVQTPIIKHYPPDTAAAFIWLKNRQPALWRDKNQTELDKLQCEKLKKELDSGVNVERKLEITYKRIDAKSD